MEFFAKWVNGSEARMRKREKELKLQILENLKLELFFFIENLRKSNYKEL